MYAKVNGRVSQMHDSLSIKCSKHGTVHQADNNFSKDR